ncbi:replication initiator protein [Capybara microvirus Cap3_SP_546]|nr:replication initiator protein [Capybara microvirus Cap3_SP_546]
MGCYHPLKAWQIGFHDSGKPKYKITSYQVGYLYRLNGGNPTWYCSSGTPNPMDFLRYNIIDEFIEIPCGHCIGCRLKYSRDWANRCVLEAMQYDRNCFITLTYANEYLPEARKYFDKDTGEELTSPVHSLNKSDFQKFMKRLRARFPDLSIRYFACGEYGDLHMRPHFHAIIFNFDFPDKIVKETRTKQGYTYQLYRSPILEDLWPFGRCDIGELNWETCAYTARYITKKIYGEVTPYDLYNYEPEFTLSSRRPGIGRKYYDDNKEIIYLSDELIIPRQLQPSIIAKPPRYYDKLFDIDYPDDYSKVKDKRKLVSLANSKYRNNLTTLSYLDALEKQEAAKISKIKILKRNLGGDL